MPAVLRRINRIFRRNSRESEPANNSNAVDGNNAANPAMNASHRGNGRAHRHHLMHHQQSGRHARGAQRGAVNQAHMNHGAELVDPSPIKLRSHGYQRAQDGSVTLHVTLDKDQVECCVCLSAMTSKIYRCRGVPNNNNNNNANSNNNSDSNGDSMICHNICGDCHWQMRRMKSGNGHTKEMQCPMCKVKGAFIRNRALERQLNELAKSCKHSKFGCNAAFFPWDEEEYKLHEKHLCTYQPVDCPFCYQTIPGGRINFVEHLVKSIKAQHALQPQLQASHAHAPQAQQQIADEDIDQEMRNQAVPEREEIEAETDEDSFELNEESVNIPQGLEPDDDDDDDDDDDVEEEDEDYIHDEVEVDDDEEEEDDMDDDEEGDLDEDLNAAQELAEQEEEEKVALDAQMMDTTATNNNQADCDKSQVVPPCLVPFTESTATLDIHQNAKYVIGREQNQFVVNYNLGIVVVFLCPTPDCPCWKVYTVSISPNHGKGGNSRVYIQYFNDEEMTQFMDKEQSMGLVTQSLTRPTTQTLQLTLGRLHPSLLRKYFRSYPRNNPFVAMPPSKKKSRKDQTERGTLSMQQQLELHQDNPLRLNANKRLFVAKESSNSMAEMKDNDDCLYDEAEAEAEEQVNRNRNRKRHRSKEEHDATHNNETDVEMDDEDDDDLDEDDEEMKLDDDEMDEIEEYRPCKFLGISPCSDIAFGFIYGGHTNKWQDSTVHKLGFRVFTLEESLKVGSVIDARDFTGKWYQAEVVAVADADGNEYDTLDHDNDEFLEIRRAKIHYLGYSQNYDEWLNVDTDSHRIAQRGTFTIGPDLRAVRRNTTSFRSSAAAAADNNNSLNNAVAAAHAVANLDAAVAANHVAASLGMHVHRASNRVSRMNRDRN